MAKKNAKAPTVITITLPDSDGDERHGTLLIQRGDLAHVRQFAYANLSDITVIIKDSVMAMSAVEAEPPIITELPPSTATPVSSKNSIPPTAPTEPTVDIALKKGKKTVKISHLKLTGGETDAAAYRQAVQLAAILIDGKLWDGETPIRIPDVYALAKKMKFLTAADMALFALDDFVQVSESTDDDELHAAAEDEDSLVLEAPTSPVVSANGHHANGISE
ncbi:MAG: hypothetical protein L6Q98_20780 [Anaerolineae bacterium]|nr:hypothetical protein [Anaerolineae bacterium]